MIKMKRNILSFYLALGIVFMGHLVTAQNFTKVPQFYSLVGLKNSDAVFENLNGDKFPDLIISGLGQEYPPKTSLYFNDGLGNFLEKTPSPFEGYHYSALAVADVNGDSHPDLVISGEGQSTVKPMSLDDGLIPASGRNRSQKARAKDK